MKAKQQDQAIFPTKKTIYLNLFTFVFLPDNFHCSSTMGSKDENIEAQENDKEKGMSQMGYDLCCFLIPLYVFGLTQLLSGLMTYFFWDNE